MSIGNIIIPALSGFVPLACQTEALINRFNYPKLKQTTAAMTDVK